MGIYHTVYTMIAAKYEGDNIFEIPEIIDNVDELNFNMQENIDETFIYVGEILSRHCDGGFNDDFDVMDKSIDHLNTLKEKLTKLLSYHLNDEKPDIRLYVIPTVE